jgi:hypothetical protein
MEKSFFKVKQIFILLFFFLLCSKIFAQQIVHIENRRLAADKQGWSGDVNINMSFIQNQNDIFIMNNNLKVQYVQKKHSIISLTENNFQRVNKTGFINDGFQHFRYNYKYTENITCEAFQQFQYNDVLNMKFRSLTGTGPRFTVFNNDSLKTRLFIGMLYMFEYEEESTGKINRAHRTSNYVSFGFPIGKNITIDLIAYYQPDIFNPDDFRFSSQGTLEIRINNKLSFMLSQNYIHDANPPEGIRNTYYNFRNGLRYRF